MGQKNDFTIIRTQKNECFCHANAWDGHKVLIMTNELVIKIITKMKCPTLPDAIKVGTENYIYKMRQIRKIK